VSLNRSACGVGQQQLNTSDANEIISMGGTMASEQLKKVLEIIKSRPCRRWRLQQAHRR
jgi:hypothetical protein